MKQKNTETKKIPDFLDLAKKVDSKYVDYKKKAMVRIVPVLLTSHDKLSLREIRKIQGQLIGQGYVSTLLIKDLHTKNDFDGEFDSKYWHSLDVFLEDDYFLVPIFFFPPPERRSGIGHHGELVDLIHLFPHLVFQAGVFHYEGAQMLHHARIIPNHFLLKNFEEHQNKVLAFVGKYLPFVELNHISSEKPKKKNIYTTKSLYSSNLGGEING